MAPINNSFLLPKRQDPNLDCSPATPWSLFIFFASNYFAHCATVKMYPGSSALGTIVATALALFFPTSGITRAVHSISRNSWFREKNPLEKAAMAGALLMVVRNSSWKPEEGDCIRSVDLGSGESGLFPPQGMVPTHLPPASPSLPVYDTIEPATINTSAEKNNAYPPEKCVKQTTKPLQPPSLQDPPTFHVSVKGFSKDDLSAPISSLFHTEQGQPALHGYYELPAGYSWEIVPAEAKISKTTTSESVPAATCGRTFPPSPTICSNYNWVHALVGLFQAGSAGLTLYRSRGRQIEHYGYAAFGLTVIPYLIMSMINLISQMATAEYPLYYMVSSSEMEEACGSRRGGVFVGVVGAVVASDVDELDGKTGEGEALYKAKFTGCEDTARVELTRWYKDNSIPPVTIKGRWTLEEVEGAVGLSFPKYETVKLHQPSFSSAPSPHTPPAPRSSRLRNFLPQPSNFFTIALSEIFQNDGFLKWSMLYFVLPILLGCLSLLIVGALTHFENGESSKTQRAWIMSWLIVGIACGWWADLTSWLLIPQKERDGSINKCSYVCMLLIGVVLLSAFCVPAIGGFVVVAEMLKEYGICESG